MSITASEITMIYGAQKALDSVSFTINKGEITLKGGTQALLFDSFKSSIAVLQYGNDILPEGRI